MLAGLPLPQITFSTSFISIPSKIVKVTEKKIQSEFSQNSIIPKKKQDVTFAITLKTEISKCFHQTENKNLRKNLWWKNIWS